MLLSIRVIWMDLHGKFIRREDKLHEQRNALKAAQARPRPLFGQVWPGFTERTSGEIAIGEAALIACEPCLTRRLAFLRSFGK